MEQRVGKIERDIDKLWSEHKQHIKTSSGLTDEVKSINDKVPSKKVWVNTHLNFPEFTINQ